jgi:hypothetical protein
VSVGPPPPSAESDKEAPHNIAAAIAEVAELDLEYQREIRARLPSLANRRPAAYRWPEAA